MTLIAESEEEGVGEGEREKEMECVFMCVASTLLLICIIRTNVCKMHLYLFLHLYLHVYIVFKFVCAFAFAFVFLLHFTPFVVVACDCIVGSSAFSSCTSSLFIFSAEFWLQTIFNFIASPFHSPTLPLSFCYSCLSSLCCRNSCA